MTKRQLIHSLILIHIDTHICYHSNHALRQTRKVHLIIVAILLATVKYSCWKMASTFQYTLYWTVLLLIYRFDSLRNCFKSFRYLQLFRVKRTSKPCTFQISKVFFISVSILLDISAHRAWSTREYSTCTDGRKVVNSLRACMYGENHRAYDGK